MPLDEAVGYATHIVITCRPPVGTVFRSCGHNAIWRTEDLYAALPRCRTLSEFQHRLYCRRCGARGWLTINPAGR
jgi:hypothetical protein